MPFSPYRKSWERLQGSDDAGFPACASEEDGFEVGWTKRGEDWDAGSSAETASTSMTVDELENDVEYAFRVRELDEADGWSVVEFATPTGDSPDPTPTPTPPDSAPGAPARPTVTADAGQVTVAWTAPEGVVDTYDLDIALKGEGWSSGPGNIPGIDGTSYTVTGLTGGTNYAFRVRAVNDAGESGWSQTAYAQPSASSQPESVEPSFTPRAQAPVERKAPELPRAAPAPAPAPPLAGNGVYSATENSITVSYPTEIEWSHVLQYRVKGSGGPWAETYVYSANPYKLTGLQEGTTYELLRFLR